MPTTVCGFGTAEACAKPQEERRADVAHGDVREGDVFNDGAIDRFERKAAAALKDAVGDGDVLEAAVGFGAELDAAGARVAVGQLHALPRAVEHGAEFVAAGDVAVGDGEIFSRTRIAEGVGAFGADAVIPRRVDGAVGDADVAAAVDVDAVAVGVDLEVVDGEVVDAGGEDAEPTALKDGEVARMTLRQFFSAMALLPTPGASVLGRAFSSWPRLRPLPQMRPGPKMPKSWMFSPQIDCCASDCGRSPERAPMRLGVRRHRSRRWLSRHKEWARRGW